MAGRQWLVLLVLLGKVVTAQEELNTFQDAMGRLAEGVAKKYAAPVISGFGASLNAGWFHSAPPPVKWGFHLEAGFIAMGSVFTKRDRTFSTVGELTFGPEEAAILTDVIFDDPAFSGLSQDELDAIQATLIDQIIREPVSVKISGATIVGKSDGNIRINYRGTSLRYTDPRDQQERFYDLGASGGQLDLDVGGLELPMVGLGAWQVTVGTIYGTNATVRFLPPVRSQDEIGTLRYLGIGIQHNPMVWTRKKPKYNVAISLFSQMLRQGKFFTLNATAVGLTASRRFGWRWLNVTPYAGWMFEKSTMRLRYDYEHSDGAIEPLRYDVTGENRTRLTVGSSFRVLVGNLNVDYSFGKYSSLSAGLTFIL